MALGVGSNLYDLPDDYLDLSLSGSDSDGGTATKLYMQKFQHKVDFSMKSERQRKDKSDRATTDHALDRRSRAILYKMLNQGIFSEINGCISTGKEANIYHVVDANGTDLVIKVYMTSIMPFKTRDKYVKGDFRMRHGYCKSTSWKLVSKWAEKEYRNLLRIAQSGLIPSPKALRLKSVILLMTFIGKDGVAAPKLKDAETDDDNGPDWPALYAQIVNDVRTLYQKCRLVHADLSEYNILYMDGKAWMIDVSQAVEHESQNALDYLRNDCYNVNTFFRKKGVDTLTLREFFEWVVNPSLPQPDDPQSAACLKAILDEAASRGINETVLGEDDAFRLVNIPRHLSVTYPFVRDFLRLRRGRMQPEDLYYASVTGLKPDLSGPALYSAPEPDGSVPAETDSGSEGSDGSSDSSSAAEGDDTEQPGADGASKSQRRPRNESPASRKARKKVVREGQAERRRHKIPKYTKRLRHRK